MKSILIKIDYFGEWPAWFPVFLESCRSNDTIDWHLHTDCEIPKVSPSNVRFTKIDFADYCKLVSDRIGVSFRPYNAYKVSDLRPLFGHLHEDLVTKYDYFGYGDIDVIYGDIRSIYDDKVLSHNVVSSHVRICSGHLLLMKSEPWVRGAYLHMHGWKERLEDTGPHTWHGSLDEMHLSALFVPHEEWRNSHASYKTKAPDPSYYENNYFVEQWSTPFVPDPWINGESEHPETWFWGNGRLTNDKDHGREFLYLHFMNFKDKRWVNEELYGSSLTWNKLPTCMNFAPAEFMARPANERRLRIDRKGIHLV